LKAVSKLRDSPYRSGRTELWLKAKCLQVARFEVIGYKKGAGSLYLAKREGRDLIYVGKAGTGFTATMILQLAKLMKPITVQKMPLAKKPDRKNKIDRWAEPKYWAEVEYRDITTDGLLRHVTFRGLYSSKSRKKAPSRKIQMTAGGGGTSDPAPDVPRMIIYGSVQNLSHFGLG
jgi:bifunctional non-homologous end joining protein LigD